MIAGSSASVYDFLAPLAAFGAAQQSNIFENEKRAGAALEPGLEFLRGQHDRAFPRANARSLARKFAFLLLREQGKSNDPWHCYRGTPISARTFESPSNFKRLVLGCIDSSDSDQILIFSGFSRSTRFSFLCTAPHSNICQFFVCIFAIFSTEFHHFLRISNQFHLFSSRF